MPSIRLSDGAKIEYIDTGVRNDSRPVLVFLHGWGLNHQAFWPQMALRDKFRLIFIDFRGCGKSRIGDDGLSIDILGNDIFEIIENLNLKKLHIVAWSMGALALWRGFGLNSNDQIKSLTIIDMSPYPVNTGNWNNGILGLQSPDSENGGLRLEKAISGMKADWNAFSKRMVLRVISKSLLADGSVKKEDIISRLLNMSIANDCHNMSILWDSLVRTDARADLAKINIPTLLIYGMDNQLYSPDLCQWVEGNIAHSILVRFETCGHAPHLEMPDAFNAVLAEFVSGIVEETEPGTSKSRKDTFPKGDFSLGLQID